MKMAFNSKLFTVAGVLLTVKSVCLCSDSYLAVSARWESSNERTMDECDAELPSVSPAAPVFGEIYKNYYKFLRE